MADRDHVHTIASRVTGISCREHDLRPEFCRATKPILHPAVRGSHRPPIPFHLGNGTDPRLSRRRTRAGPGRTGTRRRSRGSRGQPGVSAVRHREQQRQAPGRRSATRAGRAVELSSASAEPMPEAPPPRRSDSEHRHSDAPSARRSPHHLARSPPPSRAWPVGSPSRCSWQARGPRRACEPDPQTCPSRADRRERYHFCDLLSITSAITQALRPPRGMLTAWRTRDPATR